MTKLFSIKQCCLFLYVFIHAQQSCIASQSTLFSLRQAYLMELANFQQLQQQYKELHQQFPYQLPNDHTALSNLYTKLDPTFQKLLQSRDKLTKIKSNLSSNESKL